MNSDKKSTTLKHAIVLPEIDEQSCQRYLDKISASVGSRNIHSVFSSGGVIKIYFTDENYVKKILDSGILVCENKPEGYNTNSEILNVILSKVDPIIPDTRIEKLLNTYGSLESSILHKKISEKNDFAHIESGIREVKIKVYSGFRIPPKLLIHYNGVTYEVDIEIIKVTDCAITTNAIEKKNVKKKCIQNQSSKHLSNQQNLELTKHFHEWNQNDSKNCKRRRLRNLVDLHVQVLQSNLHSSTKNFHYHKKYLNNDISETVAKIKNVLDPKKKQAPCTITLPQEINCSPHNQIEKLNKNITSPNHEKIIKINAKEKTKIVLKKANKNVPLENDALKNNSNIKCSNTKATNALNKVPAVQNSVKMKNISKKCIGYGKKRRKVLLNKINQDASTNNDNATLTNSKTVTILNKVPVTQNFMKRKTISDKSVGCKSNYSLSESVSAPESASSLTNGENSSLHDCHQNVNSCDIQSQNTTLNESCELKQRCLYNILPNHEHNLTDSSLKINCKAQFTEVSSKSFSEEHIFLSEAEKLIRKSVPCNANATSSTNSISFSSNPVVSQSNIQAFDICNNQAVESCSFSEKHLSKNCNTLICKDLIEKDVNSSSSEDHFIVSPTNVLSVKHCKKINGENISCEENLNACNIVSIPTNSNLTAESAIDTNPINLDVTDLTKFENQIVDAETNILLNYDDCSILSLNLPSKKNETNINISLSDKSCPKNGLSQVLKTDKYASSKNNINQNKYNAERVPLVKTSNCDVIANFSSEISLSSNPSVSQSNGLYIANNRLNDYRATSNRKRAIPRKEFLQKFKSCSNANENGLSNLNNSEINHSRTKFNAKNWSKFYTNKINFRSHNKRLKIQPTKRKVQRSQYHSFSIQDKSFFEYEFDSDESYSNPVSYNKWKNQNCFTKKRYKSNSNISKKHRPSKNINDPHIISSLKVGKHKNNSCIDRNYGNIETSKYNKAALPKIFISIDKKNNKFKHVIRNDLQFNGDSQTNASLTKKADTKRKNNELNTYDDFEISHISNGNQKKLSIIVKKKHKLIDGKSSKQDKVALSSENLTYSKNIQPSDISNSSYHTENICNNEVILSNSEKEKNISPISKSKSNCMSEKQKQSNLKLVLQKIYEKKSANQIGKKTKYILKSNFDGSNSETNNIKSLNTVKCSNREENNLYCKRRKLKVTQENPCTTLGNSNISVSASSMPTLMENNNREEDDFHSCVNGFLQQLASCTQQNTTEAQVLSKKTIENILIEDIVVIEEPVSGCELVFGQNQNISSLKDAEHSVSLKSNLNQEETLNSGVHSLINYTKDSNELGSALFNNYSSYNLKDCNVVIKPIEFAEITHQNVLLSESHRDVQKKKSYNSITVQEDKITERNLIFVPQIKQEPIELDSIYGFESNVDQARNKIEENLCDRILNIKQESVALLDNGGDIESQMSIVNQCSDSFNSTDNNSEFCVSIQNGCSDSWTETSDTLILNESSNMFPKIVKCISQSNAETSCSTSSKSTDKLALQLVKPVKGNEPSSISPEIEMTSQSYIEEKSGPVNNYVSEMPEYIPIKKNSNQIHAQRLKKSALKRQRFNPLHQNRKCVKRSFNISSSSVPSLSITKVNNKVKKNNFVENILKKVEDNIEITPEVLKGTCDLATDDTSRQFSSDTALAEKNVAKNSSYFFSDEIISAENETESSTGMSVFPKITAVGSVFVKPSDSCINSSNAINPTETVVVKSVPVNSNYDEIYSTHNGPKKNYCISSKEIIATKQMETLEKAAREQWENTSKNNSTKFPEKTDSEEALTKTVLITWFPWFVTTATEAEFKDTTVNTVGVSDIPLALGVGTWREITLFGKKIKPISNEIPKTSALSVNSTSCLIISFVHIMTFFLYSLLAMKYLIL
ncbi:uncharacterized protein CDAR_3961 [Caerostris darwini]|uniref:Uncharacterized protein n=1 Tax=Caerostris darwini TaxID=1538125 RepID=A0AAV4V5F4_9ARAC|nr:uncharacterized protein CDAR_3961 [Caerostris darwini]